jgi:signal transduction histidine kinase
LSKSANGLRVPAKTFLIFVVVFLIIILPVNYLAHRSVSELVKEADIRALQSEANRLVDQVKLDPITIPLTTTLPIRVQVFDGESYEELFRSSDFPQVESFIEAVAVLQMDTLVVVTALKEIAQSRGSVLVSVASGNEDVLQRMSTVRWYLFAASVGSILIAGLLVFIVTSFTMAPIRKIIRQSAMIQASGNMERVSVPRSRDEARELAEALNTMLERLERSLRTQVSFFASAAHELRTPLTIMQTELTVSLNASTDSQITKTLESMLGEVQRLNRVVNDFLLISQLKSESLEMRLHRLDLRELFYEAARKVRYLMLERNLKMQVQTTEEPIWIMADADKMSTVLINLLVNACKYSTIDSAIHVQIDIQNGACVLQVRNRIQQPIVRIYDLKEEFTKSDDMNAGTGMGLWICERVLQLHHSTLVLSQTTGEFIAVFSLKHTA